MNTDSDGHKSPGGAATPTPVADAGKRQPEPHVTVKLEAWKEDAASQRAAGVLVGTVISMMPGFAPLMDGASKKGASPPITADQQLGMAIGELLGGAVQLIGSIGLFGGGAVVTTTGAGAIVGAPAMALSIGLAGTGVLNIRSGVQNLIGALSALSSGGGAKGSAGPLEKRVKLRKQTHAEIEANQPLNETGQMLLPRFYEHLRPLIPRFPVESHRKAIQRRGARRACVRP